MRHRAVRRGILGLVAAASVGVGCRPQGVATPPKNAKTTAEPAAPDDGEILHLLADRFDPGPVPGLLDGLPPWAVTQYGLDRTPGDAALLLSLLGKWRGLPEGMTLSERMGHALELGVATLAIERGDPDGITDATTMAALAQLYGIFDMPQMFDKRGLFGSMLGLAAQGLARSDGGGSVDDARAVEMLTWLTDALSRLPRLHRRMVARMMRETPDHPGLPDVMDRLSSASVQEPGLAVALRRHALQKRGRFATAAHHRELAAACYVDLDLECGDAALAAAQALPDGKSAEFAKKLVDTKTQREQASRVLALATATGLEQQLERAGLLAELGRNRAAREAFAAIRKQHPRDARAVVGEIDAFLHDTLDFPAAFKLLDAAGTNLEHREQKYLEVAIGLRCMQLAYVVLPKAAAAGVDALLQQALPMLEPVRRDADELAALGVDKGVVLVFLLRLGEQMLPAVRAGDSATMMNTARGLLPSVLELRRKIPESRYAFDVMLAAAQFSLDQRAATAAAAQVPPIVDATLAMRAAMTRLALALTFDDKAPLPSIGAQIEAWPESFGAAARTRALARVDAVRWRMAGDAASRDRAIARYETLLAPATTTADIGDLCNFAVLLVDAGRKVDALLVVKRAVALDAASELARLHHAVLSEPVDVAALESLLGAEGQIAVAAVGWLIAVDQRPGQGAAWTKKRKALLLTPGLRARELPNAKGLGVGSSLQVGIGYSTVNGLELNLDAGPTPRVYVMPAPPTPRSVRGG